MGCFFDALNTGRVRIIWSNPASVTRSWLWNKAQDEGVNEQGFLININSRRPLRNNIKYETKTRQNLKAYKNMEQRSKRDD